MTAFSASATPDDAGRVRFGARLAAAMDAAGPLCLGIDPHPQLLADWDLPDTPVGLERFSLTALEAAAESSDGFGGSGGSGGTGAGVAAVKPQVALYERHGSAGLAVLERLLRQARHAGVLTIADAKRGDIGSTMTGYAQAWLADDSPLAADAVTLSPYLGYGSLAPAVELAASTGRGIFVLALTSNPEGASVQHAVPRDGPAESSVAREIAEAAARDNARALEGDSGVLAGTAAGARAALGPVGLVVGATVAEQAARLGLDLAGVRGALLAPGYGAQGATAASMRDGFGAAWPSALATSSRAILARGPSVTGLREGIRAAVDELTASA